MPNRSYQLSNDDAVEVWLRHWRGDYQHTIAAIYGVNQGEINKILKERRYAGSKQVAISKRDKH
jgi:cupin superfamily acireductone dioxygenase involved in methionine salvage